MTCKLELHQIDKTHSSLHILPFPLNLNSQMGTPTFLSLSLSLSLRFLQTLPSISITQFLFLSSSLSSTSSFPFFLWSALPLPMGNCLDSSAKVENAHSSQPISGKSFLHLSLSINVRVCVLLLYAFGPFWLDGFWVFTGFFIAWILSLV